MSCIQNSKPPVVPIPGIGRRRHGNDQTILDLPCILVQAHQNSPGIFRLCRLYGRIALFEGLKRYEKGPGIGLESAVQQTVSRDLGTRIHTGEFFENTVHPFGNGHGAIETGAVRHNDRGHNVSLILVGHKARGQHLEEVNNGLDQHRQNHKRDQHPFDDKDHRMAEGAGYGINLTVEPGKKPSGGRCGVSQHELRTWPA